MRPVDKGEAPDREFVSYAEVEPFLEERLGPYCSYCEFPIAHVPEVEHKESKSKGGDLVKWENLLLSCKYCNTRKKAIVDSGNKNMYLWPDKDNTFKAFTYKGGYPRVNEQQTDPEFRRKAENLYNLLKLGNIPQSHSDRDRRYYKRNEAYVTAQLVREGWEKVKNTSVKEVYRDSIRITARESGFSLYGWRFLKETLRSVRIWSLRFRERIDDIAWSRFVYYIIYGFISSRNVSVQIGQFLLIRYFSESRRE